MVLNETCKWACVLINTINSSARCIMNVQWIWAFMHRIPSLHVTRPIPFEGRYEWWIALLLYVHASIHPSDDQDSLAAGSSRAACCLGSGRWITFQWIGGWGKLQCSGLAAANESKWAEMKHVMCTISVRTCGSLPEIRSTSDRKRKLLILLFFRFGPNRVEIGAGGQWTPILAVITLKKSYF